MADPPTVEAEPAGGFRFRQMLPTLVFDVAVPILVFNLLTRCGVATLWALAAGGLSPAVNNVRNWVRARRVDPLGMIVIGFLATGTAVSLITHSVFIALVKASFLTATFGLICFGSLFAKRPLMSMIWGIAYLVEALLRVGFALTLSPARVVAVSPAMGFAVIVALTARTRRYLQAVREQRLSELRQTRPVEPAG